MNCGYWIVRRIQSIWPVRCRIPTAATWCQPLPAWVHPTGIPTPGGPLWVSSRGVNRNHIIRATLDALAYQTVDVLRAMRVDSGITLSALKVDGGASANNYLMQTQADLTGVPVLRPRCVETTAMGASYLAGLAVGLWSNPLEVAGNWSVDRIFRPELTSQERNRRLSGWNRAVACSRNWAKEEP